MNVLKSCLHCSIPVVPLWCHKLYYKFLSRWTLQAELISFQLPACTCLRHDEVKWHSVRHICSVHSHPSSHLTRARLPWVSDERQSHRVPAGFKITWEVQIIKHISAWRGKAIWFKSVTFHIPHDLFINTFTLQFAQAAFTALSWFEFYLLRPKRHT